MAEPIEAKLIGEFVGTFMLIFTIGCNVLSGQTVWAGVSIASVLAVMVYALGSCSGAHLNPAVSLALYWAGKEKKEIITKYIPVQLFAGVAAALVYCIFFWQTIPLKPAAGYHILQAGIVEALYTFMLCFVVLNVATCAQDKGNQYYGIAIGFVIVAGAYGAGNISGGCFNPAVALSLDVTSITSGFGYSLVYILFEIAGAFLAAKAFVACRPEEKSENPEAPEDYELKPMLTSEFLGTYFLVLTVGLNVLTAPDDIGPLAPAFSIAASLMCMIFALGSCSGGHFNPAVTTALVASDRFPQSKAPAFFAAQCAGGVVAALSYSMITGQWSLGLGPVDPYNALHAFAAELVYTFVLCFVVLTVATVADAPKQYIAFAIGSCITVGGFAVGGISGASLNPAVSLGIAFAHVFGGGGALYLLEYVLAEVLAGVIASAAFKRTRPSEQTSKATKDGV